MNYKRGRPKAASRACRMCGNKEYKRDGNAVRDIDIVHEHDARCPQAPAESKLAPVTRFKKNTRKWCLGKVGREHQYVWTKMPFGYGSYYARQVCQACKKLEGWCFHSTWSIPTTPKPCVCGIKEWGK